MNGGSRGQIHQLNWHVAGPEAGAVIRRVTPLFGQHHVVLPNPGGPGARIEGITAELAA